MRFLRSTACARIFNRPTICLSEISGVQVPTWHATPRDHMVRRGTLRRDQGAMLQPARLTRPRLPCATRLGGASQNQIAKEQRTVTLCNYPYIWIRVKGCERCFPRPPRRLALRDRPNSFPGKGFRRMRKLRNRGEISAGLVALRRRRPERRAKRRRNP